MGAAVISGLLLVAAMAIFAGAMIQRVAGVGLALICSPFLVLALGPVEGVLLVNVLGVAINLAILVPTLRRVEFRKYCSSRR